MMIRKLNRQEAQEAMNFWQNSYPVLPEIDADYQKIREDLEEAYERIDGASSSMGNRKNYYFDVHFGMELYRLLLRCDFNLRATADDGVWRYLSLKVVPQLVARRWGKDNEDHYWKKAGRIWLRAIWWYIYLSWQRDEETTLRLLDSPCFTTDTILNLEERTGREGAYVQVYRYIMYFYSRIPPNQLSLYRTRHDNSDLFRAIMRLNTAKVMVVEPELCLGGVREYVRSLYRDLGVHV